MKMRLCRWCRVKAKGWDMFGYGGGYSESGCEWCDCGMMVEDVELTKGDMVRLNGESPEGTMRVWWSYDV